MYSLELILCSNNDYSGANWDIHFLLNSYCFGGFNGLFAASVGKVQNDLKKVIAYSTCSQLGGSSNI